MRNLGGTIGIAATATVLNDRANFHFQRLAERLTPANDAMGDLLVPLMRRTAAPRKPVADH